MRILQTNHQCAKFFVSGEEAGRGNISLLVGTNVDFYYSPSPTGVTHVIRKANICCPSGCTECWPEAVLV